MDACYSSASLPFTHCSSPAAGEILENGVNLRSNVFERGREGVVALLAHLVERSGRGFGLLPGSFKLFLPLPLLGLPQPILVSMTAQVCSMKKGQARCIYLASLLQKGTLATVFASFGLLWACLPLFVLNSPAHATVNKTSRTPELEQVHSQALCSSVTLTASNCCRAFRLGAARDSAFSRSSTSDLKSESSASRSLLPRAEMCWRFSPEKSSLNLPCALARCSSAQAQPSVTEADNMQRLP